MVTDPRGTRGLILLALAALLSTLSGGDALAQDAASATAHAAPGIDHLGPMGMFMAADIVVKAVMVSLALASCLTWTVALAKFVELASAGRRTRRALAVLAEAQSLADARAELSGRSGAAVLFVAGAAEEAERSSGLSDDGVKERAAALLARIEARAGRTMTRGTGLLATIGSVSPFVGLFGTVWGIMNSFIGIAKSNTTNLAVVAPGIAEALLATAIGLVAAIPAVVLYNVFARAIAGYRAGLGDASGEVLRHLSRDLDRARMAGGRVAHRQAAE